MFNTLTPATAVVACSLFLMPLPASAAPIGIGAVPAAPDTVEKAQIINGYNYGGRRYGPGYGGRRFHGGPRFHGRGYAYGRGYGRGFGRRHYY